MTTMLYVWIGIIIVSLVVEALTAGMVSLWFVPAAIISLVLELFDVNQAIQISVFLVASIIFVFCFKKLARSSDHTPTNVPDMIIGKTAVVTQRIDSTLETGEVKADGKYWSVRLENGENAEVGEILEVVSISGVKLICKKTNT